MSKKDYQKFTLEQLIAKKEQALNSKKKLKTMDLYVESIDAVITIQEPTKEIVRDAVGMEEEGDNYTVYQCCIEPKLKSSDAIEGCNEPTDIVDILFKPGEVSYIAQKCLELAGYKEGVVKPIEDLKN